MCGMFAVVIILATIIGGVSLTQKKSVNARNCKYKVENNDVALANGYSTEEIIPGSASRLVTQYFGNEAKGDFNADGFDDTAFLLTQSMGGSGTFYYLAVALGSKNGQCIGTNAFFLGDRIAPQTTEFKNGEIIVNFAERKSGESMSATPSVGVSKYFKVTGNNLIEIK